MMFFSDDRLHFFRPLTGKYREQVAACLRTLYTRLYTSHADYSRAFGRDQVIEGFSEAITRTPLLDGDDEVAASRVHPHRERMYPLTDTAESPDEIVWAGALT